MPRLDDARRLLAQAVDALSAAAGASSDAELISVLSSCEGMVRRLDRVTVDAVAPLERRGAFAERGYKSAALALSDLPGWERFDTRRE
jgi:5-methylcytosine-specific restriction protein A